MALESSQVGQDPVEPPSYLDLTKFSSSS